MVERDPLDLAVARDLRIWYGVLTSTRPASAACITSATVASCARKPSRRWTRVISDAVSSRFTTQSKAESPPPTIITRFPANAAFSETR